MAARDVRRVVVVLRQEGGVGLWPCGKALAWGAGSRGNAVRHKRGSGRRAAAGLVRKLAGAR